MAWVRFDPLLLLRQRKFIRLRQRLGWTENETLGWLGRFWAHVADLNEDGDITTWDAEYIASLTNPQQPGQLMLGTDGEWPQALYRALTTPSPMPGEKPYIIMNEGLALVADWLDLAGPLLRSRYAGGQGRARLEVIWQKHGQVYGQLETNREPTGNLLESAIKRHKSRVETNSPVETEGSAPGGPGNGKDGPEMTPKDLADLWNTEVPAALPKVKALTKSREQHARVRLSEHPTFEFWQKVMATIRASKFLCGENERGWRADFDWLTGSDRNCVKIMEGKYDDRFKKNDGATTRAGSAAPEPGKYAGAGAKPKT